MNKLDLLINRIIALYLDAKTKIFSMSLLNKSWNSLVYSGYGWETLFDKK